MIYVLYIWMAVTSANERPYHNAESDWVWSGEYQAPPNIKSAKQADELALKACRNAAKILQKEARHQCIPKYVTQ